MESTLLKESSWSHLDGSSWTHLLGSSVISSV